jgi:hypothetical protein
MVKNRVVVRRFGPRKVGGYNERLPLNMPLIPVDFNKEGTIGV